MRTDDKKFWAVRDPTPVSELGDVLMEFTLSEFTRYVIGTHVAGQGKDLERLAFYDERHEAVADARQRMRGQALINRAFAGDVSPDDLED